MLKEVTLYTCSAWFYNSFYFTLVFKRLWIGYIQAQAIELAYVWIKGYSTLNTLNAYSGNETLPLSDIYRASSGSEGLVRDIFEM